MKILVGITGASGSIYAQRLIASLLGKVERIYIVATETALKVTLHELAKQQETTPTDSNTRQEISLVELLKNKVPSEYKQTIKIFKHNDFFAPIASGSSAPSHMVVVPCSMGTLARISTGVSSNLLERAADVVLKQQRPLILCPREAPLSAIHLENMLKLARLNVSIIPCAPGFYNRPQTLDDLVDFVVGKILEQINIPHNLYKAWNNENA